MDGPSLPRSIRWRLQLGLLALPNTNDELCSIETLYEYNATLLQDQRRRYHDLVEKHQEALQAFQMKGTLQEGEEDTATKEQGANDTPTTDNNSNSAALDPLTAMVREQEAQEKRRQELELKYRKERARRNRGMYEGEGGTDHAHCQDASHHQSLEVIDKDLQRLQPDHHTYHHSRKRLLQKEQNDDFDTSVKERTTRLEEILHVHAHEHITLGYRQGMHEIASYLLLVIEMDLYDVESALQSSGSIDDEPSLLSLLDAAFLVNDAFTMFERVMSNLSPAFDIKASPSQSSSPMEEMGRSVISQLKTVVCDQALYDVVKAMHCPPELYCTRWVRLMFSREVLGWRNVLLLWDVFFDLLTCHETVTSMEPSKYSKPGVSPSLQLGRFTLMQVLESTAVSMILLQRQALIEADHNESIHVLMNVPPLKNVTPLTATLLSLMRRLQVGSESSSSSIASLSASFGQMARGAFQQIESMAPTAGESFRKLYDSTTLSGLATTGTPPVASPKTRGSVEHPLASSPEVSHQSTPVTSRDAKKHATVAKSNTLHLADTLKKSTSTITDYLMEVKANDGGTGAAVPEAVWEALAHVESVRKQLLHESMSDGS